MGAGGTGAPNLDLRGTGTLHLLPKQDQRAYLTGM